MTIDPTALEAAKQCPGGTGHPVSEGDCCVDFLLARAEKAEAELAALKDRFDEQEKDLLKRIDEVVELRAKVATICPPPSTHQTVPTPQPEQTSRSARGVRPDDGVPLGMRSAIGKVEE